MSTASVNFNAFDRLYAERSSDILNAVDGVGRSGWFILGKEVLAFEEELARLVGARHAIGVANGMDALTLALAALGLRPGDLVATTPLSAFATTLAILRAGGVPVFVDVDDQGLMDLDALEDCLRARSCRFVLPVHLYGQPLDLDRLDALRAGHGFKLVEDAAQAIGARWRGRACGGVGDAGCTSFYPTKNLGALGDGGAVWTSDAEAAEAVRRGRDYGQSAKYVHAEIGMNSRLDELHAAILRRAMLPRLEQDTSARRRVAAEYRRRLASPRARFPKGASAEASVSHLAPMRVASPDGFIAAMKSKGVEVLRHYPRLIPDQPAMAEAEFVIHGGLEKARDWSEHAVSLPCHPFLTPEEVDRVCVASLESL